MENILLLFCSSDYGRTAAIQTWATNMQQSPNQMLTKISGHWIRCIRLNIWISSWQQHGLWLALIISPEVDLTPLLITYSICNFSCSTADWILMLKIWIPTPHFSLGSQHRTSSVRFTEFLFSKVPNHTERDQSHQWVKFYFYISF